MRNSKLGPVVPTSLVPRRRRVLAGTACAIMLAWTGLQVQTSATAAPAATAAVGTPVYLNTSYSFAARAADLVSRMTFAEKAAQLNVQIAPAIPRLGVQDYMYWSEGAHGINYLGAGTNVAGGSDHPPATSFPVNFASSMSWDKDLMYQETTAISDEARGYLDKSLFGVAPNNIGRSKSDYGSLTFWAPTVNMDRDPRWGRNDEGFGEDPYLVGQMAGAFVNGYQGNTTTGQSTNGYLKVAATAKHFALNDVEKMRKAADSVATDADIRNYYTAQFKSLIEDSHVSGLMTSYNAINGTPAVVDTYTNNQIAQRTYGFGGYTTSDCGAIATVYDLPTASSSVAGHNWAPPGWTTDGLGDNSTWTNTATGAKISAKAGAQAYALRAGTYLNCDGGENTVANLQAAINVGILSDGVIDTALTRVFAMRMATGEFDPASSVPYTSITKANIESPAHQALAEKVATNDLVLLKNDKPALATAPLLPLNAAKLNNVVILGDMANKVTLGGYSGTPTTQVNAVQGLTSAIKAANPGANILFDAAGTSSTSTSAATLSASTQTAIKNADLVVLFVGTSMSNATENVDRSNLDMPGNYRSLITQTTALGNPNTAMVIQSNSPVKIDDIQAPIPSILFSGYNGQSQGTALANVMLGKQNPSGHLNFTWYKDASQLPAMSNYGLAPAATGGLGRTYQYFTGAPTYPFGHGLSYTNFAYSAATVDKSSVTADGTVNVTFTVTNQGSVSGAAVAQLYAATPNVTAPAGTTAVPLPAKRLAGFQKTQVLAPGAAQKITLPVKIADLAFWDSSAMKSVVYDGTYRFQVGSSSAAIASTADVTVSGALTPRVQYVTVQPESVVYNIGDTIDLTGKNRWIKDDTTGSTTQDRNLGVTADHVVEAVNSDQSFVNLSGATVSYSSSDTSVATVSSAGKVTTVGAGTATITVTVNGVNGSVPIVVTDPLVNGGVYEITAAGQAIDDPRATTTPDTQLDGWASNGGTNQQWTATQNSDGTWQLKNGASGLCMDVRHASGSAGAAVIQWTCTGATNQRWSIDSHGGGYALKSASSGLVVTEASASNGALLTQQPYTGAAAQSYTFTKVG
ncbi:glycoside hydrolase family 3 C-terminal domain-containing protein [Kitasatospora sp. NBC_00240]|uniref:glycoside hydrolase family 3 C-terminal domain-containing protein n=1 Tax=Kitasatospora sp. NBC_00240 TaxID=2903567 RepID=UPI002255D11E|nr:glycoside hydrolase family 3 C-terminal domain-containing protein [Kitasatospora sp. NBC_00240]MCX5208435.1 glycoside hydrolase family 3 C-terminal domain-containing protein [Kitasatospora sp. NBC_00240]